ncbi:MAG: hydrogenase maturation nickel metallochaperone HypA [Bryobacteraceae bacterium]|nr:hydrogenase maturation nickel metallochaperone HypA [Bryobacteraceae bacterium]
MHELAITQAMLDVVLKHAGGARVRKVNVTVGEWTGYVGESIELFWQELARGTAAEGARLEFRFEPALLRCRACGERFPVNGSGLECPRCGSLGGEPAGGQDCTVDSIEVEGGEGP